MYTQRISKKESRLDQGWRDSSKLRHVDSFYIMKAIQKKSQAFIITKGKRSGNFGHMLTKNN